MMENTPRVNNVELPQSPHHVFIERRPSHYLPITRLWRECGLQPVGRLY